MLYIEHAPAAVGYDTGIIIVFGAVTLLPTLIFLAIVLLIIVKILNEKPAKTKVIAPPDAELPTRTHIRRNLAMRCSVYATKYETSDDESN